MNPMNKLAYFGPVPLPNFLIYESFLNINRSILEVESAPLSVLSGSGGLK